MVLYNAAKRARTAGQLANRDHTGGGSKKMGLFPSIGNDSWTSIAYGKTPGKCLGGECSSRCLTLTCSQTPRYPNVCQVGRPVGMSILVSRFKC